MDPILRALTVYLVLLLIFRITGKRTLAQITTFDFVLLLIISESTEQAMLGPDSSVTGAVLVIITLIVADQLMGLVAFKSDFADKLVEGRPLVILEDGRPLHDRMRRVRVSEADILESARQHRGLERLEQIKYAVLEKTGGITVIPARAGEAAPAAESN